MTGITRRTKAVMIKHLEILLLTAWPLSLSPLARLSCYPIDELSCILYQGVKCDSDPPSLLNTEYVTRRHSKKAQESQHRNAYMPPTEDNFILSCMQYTHKIQKHHHRDPCHISRVHNNSFMTSKLANVIIGQGGRGLSKQ